jgi:predicted CoA-binding protein/signal transduction histidine kinase
MMYDFNRKVPLFANLPEDDLARVCKMLEEVKLSAGQELFPEGGRGDRAYIIESGELEVIKASGGRPILLSVRGAGDVIGEMALLEDAPRNATVRARSDAVLYAINQEQFEQLLNNSPTATRVMLNTVLTRYRSTSSMLRQTEKMAQLGTLTAGVAHELNNPAAAVKRGAGQLEQYLERFAVAQYQMALLTLSDEQKHALDALQLQTRHTASQPTMDMDPLLRSDREDEVVTWLDENGIPNAWELAPTLINLGYDMDGLTVFADQFTPDQLSAIISWLGAIFTVHSLLAEIGQGASRISEIVKALKSYTYLDQAPVQEVDVHEGIDNTLLILRSKLTGLKVQRDYASNLPHIQAFGSELNQVWTNLIDNAADAVADAQNNSSEGQITIRTIPKGDWIWVEIEDNGGGIPPEVMPRIFDTFFTTKPPGKGTGLGLEISYNIIVNKHRGDIRVFSQPGKTIFRVTLPVNFEAADTLSPDLSSAPDNRDDKLENILQTAETIAIVGISSRPDRAAYSVPAYLQAAGYQIIPVNPHLNEALGEKAYPDLLSIPQKVDVVDIFRRSDDVLPIVEQAIKIGAKVIWMQEGIVNEHAAELARQAGLEVVMDTCIRAAHRRVIKAPH